MVICPKCGDKIAITDKRLEISFCVWLRFWLLWYSL